MTLYPFDYSISADEVTVQNDQQTVVIRYFPERTRPLAALTVPVTDLEFSFTNYSEEEVGNFMDRFDKGFQKGGG